MDGQTRRALTLVSQRLSARDRVGGEFSSCERPSIWGIYHDAAGETPDPTRAVLGVLAGNLVSDALEGVAGIRIAVTGSGNVVYVAGGGLDPAATVTTAAGQAVVFRVLPGQVTVTGSGGGIVHSRTIPTWPDVANNLVLQLNAP